jgi:hypothetical protein
MKFKFPMRSKFVEAWEYAILNWGNGITSFFSSRTGIENV